MQIPGHIDPVPVPRVVTPRADGKIDLLGGNVFKEDARQFPDNVIIIDHQHGIMLPRGFVYRHYGCVHRFLQGQAAIIAKKHPPKQPTGGKLPAQRSAYRPETYPD